MSATGAWDSLDVHGPATVTGRPKRWSAHALPPPAHALEPPDVSGPVAVGTQSCGTQAVLRDAAAYRRQNRGTSTGALEPMLRDGSASPESPQGGCVPLADGRLVTIHSLGPSFAAHLEQFIRELSPQARAMRFHSAFREPPAALLEALIPTDQNPQVAWVVQECARDGSIVAEARYAAVAGEAEFALVVGDAWRRQGLGRALLSGLLRRAAAAGIGRMWGYIRRDNEPMLQLATSAGFELRSLADDPTVVVAERRIEAGATPGPSASRRGLDVPAGRAISALAPSRLKRTLRWMRAYGLPVVAALVLPGGLLVAAAAGVMRLWRRRSARRVGIPIGLLVAVGATSGARRLGRPSACGSTADS